MPLVCISHLSSNLLSSMAGKSLNQWKTQVWTKMRLSIRIYLYLLDRVNGNFGFSLVSLEKCSGKSYWKMSFLVGTYIEILMYVCFLFRGNEICLGNMFDAAKDSSWISLLGTINWCNKVIHFHINVITFWLGILPKNLAFKSI